MGNITSEEEIINLENTINDLKKLQFNNLDIGLDTGSTGYIDFIKPEDLNNNNVMNGFDFIKRPFYVIKAEIEYSDKSISKTFTTLFQRYAMNKTLWHSAGHYGRLIFDTSGGASLSQIKMIYELLLTGIYYLDEEKNRELRIINMYKYTNEEKKDSVYPTIIKLGYSS